MLLVNKYHVLHISSHRQKRGWFFPAGRKLKIPRGKSDHFIFPSLIALLVEIHSFPFSLFPNHHAQSAPANGTHIRSHSGSVFACDYPVNRLTDWFMCVTINYGDFRKWYLGVWWSGCGHNNSQSAGQWLSMRNWGCGAAQPFGAQEDLARLAEASWATLMMPRGSLSAEDQIPEQLMQCISPNPCSVNPPALKQKVSLPTLVYFPIGSLHSHWFSSLRSFCLPKVSNFFFSVSS